MAAKAGDDNDRAPSSHPPLTLRRLGIDDWAMMKEMGDVRSDRKLMARPWDIDLACMRCVMQYR